MTEEETIKRVDEAVSLLKEHFEHVQILVSWESDNGNGNTLHLFRGLGNWYAREGMCREFLRIDNARTIAHEINLKDEDE